MINKVLLAGRLLEDARVVDGPAGGSCELRLEVHRVAQDGTAAERCPVRVRFTGEKRLASLPQWLVKGKTLMVRGYLQDDADGLGVFGEWIEFMEDGLVARNLVNLAVTPARGRVTPAPVPAAVGPRRTASVA